MMMAQAFDAIARLCATVAVAGLWQGIALATVAALSLRLVPRSTATARFLLWSAVLMGAACLPFLHMPGTAQGSTPPAQTGSLLHLGRLWSFGIAALWVAFSLLRLIQLAVQGVRLHRLWKSARPIAIAPELATVLASVPLRRVELCISSEVDRPSVIGFFAPRILIPDWLLSQLTAAELFQIVLHEAEHLRRADDWLNLLQKLSLALFPLNPALVWIERRLCSERELACDDGVLRVTLAPRVYATCLTTLAERRLEHRSVLSLALGALGGFGSLGRSELSRRVYSILNRQPSLSPARARAVTVMVAVGLFGCATELARSPQLVSFSAPTPAQQERASTDSGLQSWEATELNPRSGLQNVAFHGPVSSRPGEMMQPHMTLLKATMPVAPSTPRRFASKHALRAPRLESRTTQPARGYVVMTSWTLTQTMTRGMSGDVGDGRPAMTRMTVTVARMPVRTVEENPVSTQDWNAEQSLDRSSNRSQGQAAAQAQDGAIDPALQAPRRTSVRQVFPQYAALPTDLGWVILEL